jgi:hypothetical protein
VEDKNPIFKAPDAPPTLPSHRKNSNLPIAGIESPDSYNVDHCIDECKSENLTPPPLNSKDVSSQPEPSAKLKRSPYQVLAAVIILLATFITFIQYFNNNNSQNTNLRIDNINDFSAIERQIESDKRLSEILIPDNNDQISLSSNTESEFFLLMAENREAAIRKSDKNFSVSGLQNGKMLNVRTGPGTSYQVMGKIPNRYRGIKILSSHPIHSDWVLVNILFKQGHFNGWVHGSYLKEE